MPDRCAKRKARTGGSGYRGACLVRGGQTWDGFRSLLPSIRFTGTPSWWRRWRLIRHNAVEDVGGSADTSTRWVTRNGTNQDNGRARLQSRAGVVQCTSIRPSGRREIETEEYLAEWESSSEENQLVFRRRLCWSFTRCEG
jgi:hypothetical protein